MRAMILAAGRGERMGELTLHTPKPLLRVAGSYLIEYAINSLERAGIKEIIINLSWLGAQIKTVIGDGSRYRVKIKYIEEVERLETGGGIFNALPLLGDAPFLVTSSDIITDYAFDKLYMPSMPATMLAHLVLVDNPNFLPEGDFGLRDNNIIDMTVTPRLTFANIGVYSPQLFSSCESGHFRLAKVLLPAILRGSVTGEHYTGVWYNVGTPQLLEEINLRARWDSALQPLVSASFK